MKHLKLFALLLTAVLLCCNFTAMAPLAEDINLAVNGGFENGVDNWTYSGDPNELLKTIDSAEGDFYAKPAPGSYLQQIIPVEGYKTYKLSFKMQSTTEDAAKLFYQASFMSENVSYRNLYTSIEDDPDQYRAVTTENTFSNVAFGTKDAGGELEWKEYSILIPVPSMKIDAFRLRLIFGVDLHIAIDDIRFEKVKDDCTAVINGDFENANAASLTSAVAWSSPADYTYAQNGGVDNSKYFKGELGTELFYQFVPVDENTTYRLSFKMKSSKKDGAGLNLPTTNFVYKDNVAVKTTMANAVNFGLSDYTGADAEVWRNYSLEFSTPADVNVLRLAIQNNGDTALGIDDISIEKVEGKYNYVMNGDFEAGMAAWGDIGGSGSVEAEENGNLYFSRTATEKNKYIRQLYLSLPAGRYQISFKAKTANKGDLVSVNLFGSDGRSKAEALQGWCADYISGKKATCNASFTDDWQTFNFYFTLSEAREDIVLALSNAYWGAGSGIGAMYFDDVSVIKDETRLEFASYTQEDITDESFAETKNGAATTSLEGVASVPVFAHYVPKADGTSEKVTLCAALYKEGETKKLVDFKVVGGETAVSEETMQGKNAGAILSLATDMEIPDDADDTYVLKASLYSGGTLVDIAYKTISIGW